MSSNRHCKHSPLETDVSSHAIDVGFAPPDALRRAAATTFHGIAKTAEANGIRAGDPSTFPAPLALPGDDLTLDPRHPAQSLRSTKMQDTRKRNTMYFAAAPGAAPDAQFVESWAQIQGGNSGEPSWKSAPKSMFDDVHAYLTAFYHGMKVKRFEGHLRFVNIEQKKSRSKASARAKSKAQASGVGLEFDIRGERHVLDIRARISPHEETPTYPRQLNLDDLLDAAIAMLPDDAYALLLLVDHDIYEDDDDDFACGRAYGGSRVAVVSASRYNPALDDRVDWLDREHAWPASHCGQFIKEMCETVQEPPKDAKGKKATTKLSRKTNVAKPGPLTNAVHAFKKAWLKSDGDRVMSLEAQGRLWLSRVCKTASHELGHCVGMGHCVYYACIMQGTAGLAEDSRQPPYLCPVDLAKTRAATGGDDRERYEALLALCESEGWKEEPMFAAYGAWLKAVLEEEASVADEPEIIVID